MKHKSILAAGIISGMLISGSVLGGCKWFKEPAETKEEVSENEEPPKIVFNSTEHYFGEITEGEQVGWYFYFTNTGGSDLIIHKASSSCGCTVPEFSREPIPPGGEGHVRVVYNSSGRKGFDTKFVKVETNAANPLTRLKIEVEIKEKSNT